MTMRRPVLLVALLLLGALMIAPVHAQQVIQLAWPTRHAASPAEVPPEAAEYLPMLRASAAYLPESTIVAMALSQSSALGLDEAQAQKLGALVAKRYERIEADPRFKDIPSALGYCFSEKRPSQGQALVCVPRGATAQTPVMLFIHGYGGSFLWYAHQLAEWFPDRIIICPAYGISPANIPAQYVGECLAATAKRIGHPLSTPTIVGLSAGGFGAARLYTTSPAGYRRLVVIGAYPPDDVIPRWPKTAQAGFVVGSLEDYVQNGAFAARARSLSTRSAGVRTAVIAGADHFFLITHPEQTRKTLLALMPKS